MRRLGHDKNRQSCARGAGGLCAFTLVELMVVVAIIALLIGLILPTMGKSIRQARSTVCKSNLKDLYRALDMYQTENNGWLPTVDAGTAFRSSETWAAKLFENNPSGLGVLFCPEDPWASLMRNSLMVEGFRAAVSASYGLNDFIVSSPNSFLSHIGRHRPKRPDETILLADMGPDIGYVEYGEGGGVALPLRNQGRLAIDDGYAPGDPPGAMGDPWLTGRHRNKINVLSLAGNVRDVDALPALSRPIQAYYENCAALSCTMCVELDLPHYSFAESRAFWWTGPVPKP